MTAPNYDPEDFDDEDAKPAEGASPTARNLWGEEAPLPAETVAAALAGRDPDELEPTPTKRVPDQMLPDQVSMFDLAGYTVRAPDADVMEKLDQTGVSVGSRKKTFEQATIKQTVFYFPLAEYTSVISRMGKLMKTTGLKDHTRVFLAALTALEMTYDGSD